MPIVNKGVTSHAVLAPPVLLLQYFQPAQGPLIPAFSFKLQGSLMRPSPPVSPGSSIPPHHSRSPAAPTEEVSHMSVLPTRLTVVAETDIAGMDR